MSGSGVNNIGSATEKALKKQDEHQLDKLRDEPDNRDASEFDTQLQQDFKNESKTSVDGSPVVFKKDPGNLADRILNGFQGLKDNIDNRHQKVDKMLSSDEALSMKDMFQTQRAMTNLMLTEDLIGKVVGKSTQIVETMMKQQ